MQRVEQTGVRHEQQRLVWMPAEPFADDANRSGAGFVPLLGVRRQMPDQPLMRLQSELSFDLVHDQTFESAEMLMSAHASG